VDARGPRRSRTTAMRKAGMWADGALAPG
jgi:hypothetical protein